VKKTPYPLVHEPTPGSERTPMELMSAAETLPRSPDTDTIGPTGGGHAGVEVGVAVAVGVAVPVDERGGVCETDEVDEGLLVAVCDGVAVGLGEAVPVGDAVTEGVRSDARLRPCSVMRATSVSLPSHSTASRTPLAMVLEGTSCVTLTYR